jgi:hypothetical protein
MSAHRLGMSLQVRCYTPGGSLPAVGSATLAVSYDGVQWSADAPMVTIFDSDAPPVVSEIAPRVAPVASPPTIEVRTRRPSNRY